MTTSKDYFQTICRVSRAFGTAKKNDELLQLIVTEATSTMDAKGAALFLADEEKDIFISGAQTGLSDRYLHAEPSKARTTIEEVLKGGHIEFYDATTDPRVENHAAKKEEGVASILVVPIMVKGKAIGILSLYTGEKRSFLPEEVEFLSALAEQGGMAIQNTRLLNRIRQNSELFLNFAANINSSLDIKQILHILTADISEALGLKGANIRLLDKDKNRLELVASYGLSQTFLDKGPLDADKSVSKTLSGQTIVIPDAGVDERIQYRSAIKAEGIVTMVSVPIRAEKSVIGVMRLFSGYEREFPEDMILLINALANQGGLAIQNAHMYLRMKDDKECIEKDIWSHRMWF